jgi:hypothetical protein
MHAVCELHSFRRAAAAAGMSEEEVSNLVSFLSANVLAGDEIVGTGGCRKLRLAGRGKGESGGYRVVTFFTGESLPVFLITVFGKGEKADLTQGERNALRTLTSEIAEEYRQGTKVDRRS